MRNLTRWEQQVMELLLIRIPESDMAEQLCIPKSKVKSLLKSLYEYLGVNNYEEAYEALTHKEVDV